MNNRQSAVLKMMKKEELDALLITEPSSIFYLTEYDNQPGERFYCLLLKSDGSYVLFLNDLFQTPEEDLNVCWYNDTDSPMKKVKKYLKGCFIIGVDKSMMAKFLLPLIKDTDKTFIIDYVVEKTRQVKDIQETALMLEASLINDEAMNELPSWLYEGVTEKEVANKLLQFYLSHGSTGFSFDPIIAFGKNGAISHHEVDDTPLRRGDSIIVDIGCKYRGYCSDMTRTFFFGEVSKKQMDVYNLVKNANEAAEKAIHPGMRLCDIDETARSIIKEAGYGQYFNHRLGHFIGLDVHEYGDVSASYKDKVKPGMIFSIEPGIYLEGDFGVRIEDLVIVTEDGCKVINSTAKDLRIL